MVLSELDPPNGAPNSPLERYQDLGQGISYQFGSERVRLNRRYKPHKVIGCGAYGLVISATDLKTNEEVAVKKISKAFEDTTDGKRILREVKLLRHFDHENIISLYDILLPPSLVNFKDVYFVTDLMETDLHKLINSSQVLSGDHVKFFIFQILRALEYIHSCGVIHRDIKPQNILVNSECHLKLCDFGLARADDDEQMTEYVVTRWYRAPEVLLASKQYGPAVDVWAVGCIFYELFARSPLFPGNDYLETTKMICSCLGKPSLEDIEFVTVPRARKFILHDIDYNIPLCDPLSDMLDSSEISCEAAALIENLLVLSPSKRISASKALQKKYFECCTEEDDNLHNTESFRFSLENSKLSRGQLKELMFREIAKYNSKAKNMVEEAALQDRLHFPLALDEK